MCGERSKSDAPDAVSPSPAAGPFPRDYQGQWVLKDGTAVTIRPICPEDEPLMIHFHQTLSERTVYTRYFHPIKLESRTEHARLARICFIDYDREMVLVAERSDPQSGQPEILGVGRLSRLHPTNVAEFAILLSDRYQGQGLGTELLRRLVDIGRDQRLACIIADILPENRGMQAVCKKLGFRLRHAWDEGVVKARLDLAERNASNLVDGSSARTAIPPD